MAKTGILRRVAGVSLRGGVRTSAILEELSRAAAPLLRKESVEVVQLVRMPTGCLPGEEASGKTQD